MRILIYGLNFAPEPVGTGRYSGELAQWLQRRGHEVRVVTAVPYFPRWQAEDNRYRRQRLQGVEVWRAPLWVPRQPRGVTRLLHLASFALSSLPLLLAQLGWRPQVVFTVAPAFFCAPGALLLTRLAGRRCRAWLHIQDFELDAAFALGMLRGRWLQQLAAGWERRTLRGFDRLSSISEAMLRHAQGKGVDPRRCHLLPNWVDLQAIQPQTAQQRALNPYRQELGITADSLVLQYSGSMNQKQGLQLLVTVIQYLQHRRNLVWLLAGEGPSRQTLAAATAGFAGVRLLPLQPAERLNDWFNLADVHLLPQRAGAADLVLPSKVLAILASGRPMVASTPAGSSLGQLADQAGLRVEPEDPLAFAAAVERLLDDPALRQQKGQSGRHLAEEHYGRDAVLMRLEKGLVGLAAEGVGR